MKKLVLAVCVFLLAANVVGADNPTDKGSAIIGGSFTFTSYGGDAWASITNVSFYPTLSYFVAPNIVIGPEIGVNYMSSGGGDNTEYGVGAHLGYYGQTNTSTLETKGSVYSYIKGFFVYYSLSNGDIISPSFGGQVGFVYMLSGALGMDLGLRFTYDNLKPDISGAKSVSGTRIMAGLGITGFLW